MAWRKVTRTVGETGAGVENREETEYQFGDEIDGVFVPYGTKSAGYIEHLIQREKDYQESQKPDSAETPAESTSGTTES